jgi:hypothetical protein
MRSTENPAVWYVSLPSKGIQMKRKHGAKRSPHTGRSSVHTRLSGGGSGADFRADLAGRRSRCNATETADGRGEQSCGDVHDDGQPKLTFSTLEWAMKRFFAAARRISIRPTTPRSGSAATWRGFMPAI